MNTVNRSLWQFHKELPPNSTISLSSMWCFSIFQLDVLVLRPTTIRFWLTFHCSHQPWAGSSRQLVLIKKNLLENGPKYPTIRIFVCWVDYILFRTYGNTVYTISALTPDVTLTNSSERSVSLWLLKARKSAKDFVKLSQICNLKLAYHGGTTWTILCV